MLDMTQVFAWARMFAGYVQTESVADAASHTFDPGKTCPICRAVSRAREASGQQAPALPTSGTQKIVLILETPVPFVAERCEANWPRQPARCLPAFVADLAVPPPREVAA